MLLPLYIIGAYLLDVVAIPQQLAKLARAEARRRGKPLLNAGCGTPESSWRCSILGVPMYGDFNCDLNGRGDGIHAPAYGDVYSLPFADKTFGAALCSHVVEHLDHPEAALRELARVADTVFFYCPQWWDWVAWIPDHRQYFDGQRFHRLRTPRRLWW
jgi:SAM-dependent methyltransferase